MSAIRYPRFRDAPYDARVRPNHCEIDVTWKEEDSPQRFCGDNWCSGGCELPALVIPIGAKNRVKASGSQVAMGPLFQPIRVEWGGRVVEVPEEYRAGVLERWWL